jgi:hypothetical protein
VAGRVIIGVVRFACATLIPCLAQDNDLAARVSRAESLRDSKIVEVRSFRHYTVRNPRWDSDATMKAVMITSADGAKRYEILKTDSEGFRKKILTKILEGEVQAAARKDRDGNVNADNYELRLMPANAGAGESCRMVQLIPRKRTRFTFDGHGCVDMNDLAMVRMEGRTAKNISFLVGRAYVKQEFRKVGEFWYSSASHSVADVKFLGRTELIIKYLDYSITVQKSASSSTARAVPARRESE